MNLERGKSYLFFGDLGLTRNFGGQLIVIQGTVLGLKKICILNLEDSKDLEVDIQFHYLLNYKSVCPFNITMLYEVAELEKIDLKDFDMVLVHGIDYLIEMKSLLSTFKRLELTVLATTRYSEVLMDSFDFAIRLKRGYTKDDRSDLSYQMLKPLCSNKVKLKGKFYHFYHYDFGRKK